MVGKIHTLKIVPGDCRNSLANVVMAQEFGEDHPSVLRALKLLKVKLIHISTASPSPFLPPLSVSKGEDTSKEAFS